MPNGAEILAVHVQKNEPCIWALVDSEQPLQARFFDIFGTGHMISPPLETLERKYIGSFQLQQGQLVFHVFESIEKP